MIIDIHTHSLNTSDGYPSVEELVKAAKEKGLDGICLTDTNCIADVKQARTIAHDNDFLVLVGFEAYTNCGHFLGFVPQPEALPPYAEWLGLSAGELVDFNKLSLTVKNANGVLIAACPYDRSLESSPCDSLVNLKGISAVEVVCSTLPTLANEMAEELAAGVGLPGVGGSNIHGTTEEMGIAATLVRGPVESEKDLIDRILSYDVWPVSIGKKPLIGNAQPRKERPRNTSSYRSNRRDGRRSDSRRHSGSSDNKRRPRREKT